MTNAMTVVSMQVVLIGIWLTFVFAKMDLSTLHLAANVSILLYNEAYDRLDQGLYCYRTARKKMSSCIYFVWWTRQNDSSELKVIYSTAPKYCIQKIPVHVALFKIIWWQRQRIPSKNFTNHRTSFFTWKRFDDHTIFMLKVHCHANSILGIKHTFPFFFFLKII